MMEGSTDRGLRGDLILEEEDLDGWGTRGGRQTWLNVPYRTVLLVHPYGAVRYGGLRTLPPVRYANCTVRSFHC